VEYHASKVTIVRHFSFQKDEMSSSLSSDNGFPIRSPRGTLTSASGSGGLKSSQLVTATIMKKSGVSGGLGVPPPVPPNKPAIPLYKNASATLANYGLQQQQQHGGGGGGNEV
jgi:hypothetical protein